MNSWQRKRKPEDVPTPVAVAVSDFCRRAKTSSSAAEVREALSLLGDDEDFRVRELTDAEPQISPLGPFAVVDLVRGTDAALAKQRQQTGYYEVVREVLNVRDLKVVEVPVAAEEVPSFAPRRDVPAPAEEKAPSRKDRKKAESIAEKIAPKKRAATTPEIDADESYEAAPLLPFQERREKLPKPKGRFSRLEASKGKYDDLFRSTSKQLLSDLITQEQNRRGVLRALSERFGGKRGQINALDVQDVLKHHGLQDTLEAREREQILSCVSEHRGAMGRVCWALGMSGPELEALVSEAKLLREVEEVRERFRREALSPKNLTLRLDLLGREKYLVDLGIKKRFSESLAGDLRKIFRESASTGQTMSRAIDEVARKQGAPTELLQRAIEKLGIAPELERHLSGAPSQPA